MRIRRKLPRRASKTWGWRTSGSRATLQAARLIWPDEMHPDSSSFVRVHTVTLLADGDYKAWDRPSFQGALSSSRPPSPASSSARASPELTLPIGVLSDSVLAKVSRTRRDDPEFLPQLRSLSIEGELAEVAERRVRQYEEAIGVVGLGEIAIEDIDDE
ncbi:hypothetical protein JCM10213v2_008721 [Rhodosporidiobolus nylandii]